jgi:hypothetical protein
MYKCLKNGKEIFIESELALEEMLAKGILTGEERALNTENGIEGVLKQSQWYKSIIERNPAIIKESSGSKVAGIICTVIGLVMMVGYATIKSMDYGEYTGSISKLIGIFVGSVSIPLIIWGVTYWVRKTKRKGTPGIRVFGIAYLVCSMLALFGGVSANIQRAERSVNFNNSLAIIESSTSNITEWEPIIFDEATYGEYAALGTVFQDYCQKYNQMNIQFREDSKNIGAKGVLQSEILKDENAIKKSIGKTEQLIARFETYQNETKSLNEEYDQKIEKLDIPNALKKNFLENRWMNTIESQADLSESYIKSEKVMEETLAILKFMESKQGEYKFEGEQLLFYTDEDLNRYNTMYTELQKSSTELQQMDTNITE